MASVKGNGQKTVSVILLNYNQHDLLQQCIDHLLAYDDALALEIIVVDNGSQDGSRDWLQTLDLPNGNVVLSASNLGFAGGNNLGLREASGEYLLLLNTDAFPEPQSLELLVNYLEENPKVGIVGPQLVYPDGGWQRSGGFQPSVSEAMQTTFGIVAARQRLLKIQWRLTGARWQPRPVQQISGAAMMIRRTMRDEIGELDDSYFFYVEDAEYCYRARQKGWQVHLHPRSQVIHLRGGSTNWDEAEKFISIRLQSLKRFIVAVDGAAAWRRYLMWAIWRVRRNLFFCKLRRQKPTNCKRLEIFLRVHRMMYEESLRDIASHRSDRIE